MTYPSRHPRCLLALLAPVALLAACSATPDGSLFGLITPYRMEVVQGNVVTREMASGLREGLTRDQVRSLLGSPLLADVFHADRWDYVFTIRRQGAPSQQRRLTVHFSGDKVSRFEVPDLPSEREFVSSIDATRLKPRTTPLELDDTGLAALPLPKGRAAPAPAPADAASAVQRIYPPLE